MGKRSSHISHGNLNAFTKCCQYCQSWHHSLLNHLQQSSQIWQLQWHRPFWQRDSFSIRHFSSSSWHKHYSSWGATCIPHVMEILLMWRLTSRRTRQANCCISCRSSLPTNHFNIHTSSKPCWKREFTPKHEPSSRIWLTKLPCMPKCITIAEANWWHWIVMLRH